jgi:Domain of unknown function (DUF4389)
VTGPDSESGGSGAPGAVLVTVEPTLTGRNRLTTALRLILLAPHWIILGGITAVGAWRGSGALAEAAAAMVVVAWFAVLFTGRAPRGLWLFARYYLRWSLRVGAYAALLRDEYPPFGDEDYPASVDVVAPAEPRDRLRVFLRPLLIIPQLVALVVVDVAWLVTTILAWFAILFSGTLPAGLARFGAGALRWNTRVQAYGLLLTDAYPPFSLSEPGERP